ncbi:MAG TPA: DNA-binding protein [Bacillus bacterium]|nr:DNA-binding protein [Bacillus sp. (in: firmicutes)]
MRYVAEEIQMIKDQIGTQSVTILAKRMNRTMVALEVKIKRMGISNTKSQTGMITAGELARILQVDRNTVICWIINHELESQQRITRTKKRFMFINIEDFWNWADNNRNKIDFSKLEPNALPPEPDWVDEERKVSKAVTNYKVWTKQEEKLLLEVYRSGKNLKEISCLFGRSSDSIRNKIKRLTENCYS